MNDDNVSICSTTGIMRASDQSRNIRNNDDRRRPTSTVTRANKPNYSPPRWTECTNEMQRSKPRGNYRMQRDRDWHYERYNDEQTEGWETPFESEDENSFRNNLTRKQKQGNHDNFNYRPAHSSWYKERTREVRFDERENPRARPHHETNDNEWHRDNYRNKHRIEERDRRKERAAAGRGRSHYDTDSDTSRDHSPNRAKSKCSGITAKPNSKVKEQLMYPHFSLGQISGFIGQNIQFHQLSYEQFGLVHRLGNSPPS